MHLMSPKNYRIFSSPFSFRVILLSSDWFTNCKLGRSTDLRINQWGFTMCSYKMFPGMWPMVGVIVYSFILPLSIPGMVVLV